MTDREEEAIRKAAYRIIAKALTSYDVGYAAATEGMMLCAGKQLADAYPLSDAILAHIQQTRERFAAAGAVPLTPGVEEEPPE